MMSPAARLLLGSLLGIACGAAGCGDDGDGVANEGARLGNTGLAGAGGSVGSAGRGGADTSAAGQAGAAMEASGTSGTGGANTSAAGNAGAATAAAGTSATGVTSTPSPSCDGAQPFVVDGRDSGLVACGDGSYARVSAGTCRLPDGFTAPGGAAGAGGGVGDVRCGDAPFGVFLNQQTKSVLYCRYHCEQDADCPAGNRCVCGADGTGMCGVAECATASDCGAGQTCRVKEDARHCSVGPSVALTCFGSGDVCLRDSDCPGTGPYYCDRDTGPGASQVRICKGPYACGRPILVAESARVAGLLRENGWC